MLLISFDKTVPIYHSVAADTGTATKVTAGTTFINACVNGSSSRPHYASSTLIQYSTVFVICYETRTNMIIIMLKKQ